MALVLKTLYKGYNWMFEELADPRVTHLNLLWMSSPLKPTIIITIYLYFTYNLGPRLMANRKPFELKYVMIMYNAIQVLLNSYIVYEAGQEVFFNISWDCAPVDYSFAPRSLYVLKLYHIFFLIKAADLLDTIFFVLRKKNRQISFLHVYHHFGMFIMLWVAVKFFGGGSGVFVGLINGAVHAIMYTYYLLTAIDEKWKQSVTFKRTLTQIQITQFFLFIIIYGRLLFKADCTYPKLCSYFFVPQNCFMLILFGDFYRRTYLSKKKGPKEVTQNGKNVSL
ncbi:elongation of very long chain fatty acids protein 7-like [Anoplophora glabripennis]|uniref:elongation of very long chain fatty acids protein 7-like n=1 Tax=Anoplophora glabripennis TaxID=217634 RepID=UPI000874D452|nr:elongation of very long chain fatty acids protein 7-like [Anoplophora glabripennis]